MNISKTSLNSFVLFATVIVAIGGCGKKEGAEKEKSGTQVVAKVNGDEISIHQVNFQLSRMGPMNEAQSKVASQQVLARLVEQQLLKQKAIETKLDRDPTVLQALEASKSQLLAQAYLEQQMAKAAKPTPADIDKFYSEHPELFQNRRIFKLQELAIEVGEDKFSEIQQALDSKKNMNEFAMWLKSKSYKFTANANVRAAEQLPLPVLLKVQALSDGQTVAIPNKSSINIINVVASQSQPVAKDKAVPVIEQYFFNQNKTSLVKKQMEALTKAAKIEYIGPFADMHKAAQSTVATQPVLQPAAEIESSKEGAKATDVNQSHMNKGLAGF